MKTTRIRSLHHNSAFDYFNIFLMVLFTITILFPFWDMLLKSFSSPEGAMKLGFRIFPDFKDLTIGGYQTVFKEGTVFIGYYNTVFRSVIGTALMAIVVMAAAYPLSNRKLPYRRSITLFMVFTMYFNGGLIPTYLMMQWIGLIDSLWALILPSVAAVFNMILVRNYMMSVIDPSLEESAQIDGANYLLIFVKIIVPLCKPVAATICLWTLVGHWNEWFTAMIYTNSPDKEVLQLMLRKILIENSQQAFAQFLDATKGTSIKKHSAESLKAAFLYVSIAPILIIYPFLQKYFIKGIMLGAVKG
jgi:putative aldouronate transport system permease protein